MNEEQCPELLNKQVGDEIYPFCKMMEIRLLERTWRTLRRV